MRIPARTVRFGLLLFGVLGGAACSCEGEPGIQKAAVEMTLTLLEVDPCSGAGVPRRIPDDYTKNSIAMSTDFGSASDRALEVRRDFEIRSTGTAPLTIQSVSLASPDPEFTVTTVDAMGAPVALPTSISANRELSALPGLVIRVAYVGADSEPDLTQLVVKTDDPERETVTFDLAAGFGEIEVTPGALEFGDVSRGMSATKEITIKNIGRGNLDLREIALQSDSAELCAPEATAVPGGAACTTTPLCRVLAPGETYTVRVTYSPEDGGEDTGNVHIHSGDASTPTVDVPINGRGAGPGLCACVVDASGCNPLTLVDFGDVDVGTTGRRTVRLRSCGTEPVNITEVVLEMDANSPYRTGPEFKISTTSSVTFRTGMLAPNEVSEGVIEYTPTAAGEHRGGLRYATAVPNQRSWIALVGRAATCDLEAIPATVAFGTVASGSSNERRVSLVNNGTKECQVTAITDPSNGFTLVNKPALPLTINSGQSQDLTVRYTAPSRGTPTTDRSSFDVTSNEAAPGATNTVMLTAEGGGMATCDLDVQPRGNLTLPIMNRDGQLLFGAVNIGYTKVLSIRITNIGNTQCGLDRFTMTTQDPSQWTAMASGQLPLSINPGSTATLDVTFRPTHAAPMPAPFNSYGPLLNYVDFVVSGTGLTKTMWSIGLKATPTVPTIDVIPDMVDFGTITWHNPRAPDMRSSCGSETRGVRIYNSGTGPLEVTAVRIDATSDPVFTITEVKNGANTVSPPYMMSIASGQSAEVKVRFFPTRINPPVHNGLLVIENNVTMETTVPLRGEGTANASQTDTYAQLADNKVDVLWVVDDSGSMQDEQTLLANNFRGFIGYADSLGVDYQVGVITTEMNDAPAGKLWACNGFNKILKPSDPQRVSAFECASRVTSPPNGNRRPNPGGSDEAEAGLQAARMALDAPIRDMENAGFLRPDARLAVIIVSDEEDQSPGSVSLYVDFFRNIKGFRNPQLTSVSGIVGPLPSGCPNMTAEASPRYHDAVMQLGGQIEAICAQSWSQLLMNIGLGVFALRTSWTLSRPADPGSITVRVNGMVVPPGAMNGWTFDPASNSITFNGSAVPQQGSNVEIQYGSLCLP